MCVHPYSKGTKANS
jgi:hypothetical protein